MAAFGGTKITRGQSHSCSGVVVVTVVGLGRWGFSILREDIAVVRSAAEVAPPRTEKLRITCASRLAILKN